MDEALELGSYLPVSFKTRSEKDIEVCLSFDLASFAGYPHYGGMCELHDTLKMEYPLL